MSVVATVQVVLRTAARAVAAAAARRAAEAERAARRCATGLRGVDLPLAAAGATFYAGVALVPALVVLLTIATWIAGDDRVLSWGGRTADALPGGLGADEVLRRFVRDAVALPLTVVAAGLLPATVYGEGLRRAFGQVTPAGAGRWPGWRGRLAFLPLIVLAPSALLAVLATGPLLASLFPSGPGGTVAGVVVAFTVDWVLLSPLLAMAYRLLGPARPGWGAALTGAFATGAFLAGFLQGFVLFLAIPLDLGVPFGGYRAVGAAVAVALWTFLLHVVALVGHRFTVELDRPRRPAAPG